MSDTCDNREANVVLKHLADDMAELKTGMRKLTDAVTKLAVVEERQASDRAALDRAFKEIEKAQGRIAQLEQAQPIQKQSSDLVQKVVGIVMSAVVGAALMGVIYQAKPSTTPAIVERRQ